MPADSFALFKALIGWFRASTKPMIILALLAGASIFLPAVWQQQMGIFAFTRSHLVFEWGVFLFCVGMVILTAIEKIGKMISRRWNSYCFKRQMKEHLYSLPKDQLQILFKFGETRRSSLILLPTDGAVCDLVNRGILYQSAQLGRLNGVAFSVTPSALPYLRGRKFQELLLKQKLD